MWKILIFLALYATVSAGTVKRSKLPSFLKICHQSDPDLEECIGEMIDQLKPYLKDGIPELSIPPCEPLVISELVMNKGKGSISLRSSYNNLEIYGPTHFIIKSVKVDTAKDRLKIKIWIPALHIRSQYEMSGQIARFPIVGKGRSTGNYTDIEATAQIFAQKFLKEDKIYLNVEKVSVDLNIGNASINYSNLFNGDKTLGDAMNIFLNENWKNLVQDFKPILEGVIAEKILKFTNQIYHKYPLQEILPY